MDGIQNTRSQGPRIGARRAGEGGKLGQKGSKVSVPSAFNPFYPGLSNTSPGGGEPDQEDL